MKKINSIWRCLGILSFLFLGYFVAACINEGSSNYGSDVEQELEVIPQASLAIAQAGSIDNANYSGSSSDPFLDDTYVLYGNNLFSLAVLNLADQGASQIANSKSGQLQLVTHPNDISTTTAIVEINDITKLRTMVINGQSLSPADFTQGEPTISTGTVFDTEGRLPGYYALVSIGSLPAGTNTPVGVALDGDCGLEIHIDAYGKAYCSEMLVNEPNLGTTLIVKTDACTMPSPSPTPSPTPTPSCTPSPTPTPTPTCSCQCDDSSGSTGDSSGGDSSGGSQCCSDSSGDSSGSSGSDSSGGDSSGSSGSTGQCCHHHH